MLSKILPLFLLLLLSTATMTQETITGTVIDDKTGSPVSGASIYINNTQLGTLSGTDGSFVLKSDATERIELVISHVQYEKSVIILDKNTKLAPVIARLLPKVAELEGVVVQSKSKENWKKWGRLFTDYFIGTSVFADDCEILNQEVLRFSYSEYERRLKVKASDKLLVKNKALGYVYYIDLDVFEYSYLTNSILYTYTVFFEEIRGADLSDRKGFQKNRLLAYLGSRMHFMRSLYHNQLESEGFEVFRFVATLNAEKQRVATLLLAQQAREAQTNSGPAGNAKQQIIIRDRDSAVYYKAILEEPDYIFKDLPVVYPATQLTKDPSRGDVARFYFADTMLVKYNPDDSIFKRRAIKGVDRHKYRQHQVAEYKKNGSALAQNKTGNNMHASVLYLVRKEPIFIQADGLYFEGLNLFTDGAMGWKKMANLLPWEYQPGN